MKIRQIVTQMEAGGAQKVASLLSCELRERGHDSELWFLYTKRPAYAGAPGVRSLCSHPPSAPEYLSIMIRLASLLIKERPDVIITHTHYANILGHLLTSACGIQNRIAVQHNPVETYPQAARLADRIMGTLGFYSTNVAVSGTVAQSANKYPVAYTNTMRVVYNGIPDSSVRANPDHTRTKFGIPLTVPLLSNVGRLSWQKNQEFLIRLLPHLPNFHLALIGDGELRRQLAALASTYSVADRVHFTGEVSPEDVSSLLRASNVFVFPSHFEAVGLAMLEAMLAQIPVVASDIPSSREFLGDAGILVDVASSEKWVAAIQGILDRPEATRNLTSTARKRASQYTVGAMANGYERVFASEK